MTDPLALQGVTLAARSLRRAFEDGHDLDAREDMALAALLSGIALTNAGLGAVHGFAAPLGANFPAPHGAVCAALLPHVIAANIAALRAESHDHPTLARYATVGRVLAGRPDLASNAAAGRRDRGDRRPGSRPPHPAARRVRPDDRRHPGARRPRPQVEQHALQPRRADGWRTRARR